MAMCMRDGTEARSTRRSQFAASHSAAAPSGPLSSATGSLCLSMGSDLRPARRPACSKQQRSPSINTVQGSAHKEADGAFSATATPRRQRARSRGKGRTAERAQLRQPRLTDRCRPTAATSLLLLLADCMRGTTPCNSSSSHASEGRRQLPRSRQNTQLPRRKPKETAKCVAASAWQFLRVTRLRDVVDRADVHGGRRRSRLRHSLHRDSIDGE